MPSAFDITLPPPNYPEQPDLALVAAMTLMSRYACCRNPALAEAAVSQLQAISCDERISGKIRECATSLLAFWLKQAGNQSSTGVLH